MLNVIMAKFCSGATQTWTEEAYQWDYGQVLQFEGLELPEAYQVHFSNTPLTGETITQIGGADGVTVPDQFFTGGETIYAWVYLHEGEDDGETVYMVTIPVKKRPQPSDDVPTPVEQSAIDQAIAALNIAVEKADEAITHYPTIIDGTWHVWDVTEEEYVDTGVEAQGQPGQPGRDGTDGQDGQDGQDGFSPVITVTDITGGHRVTITDATGTQTFDVMNGQNGTPGRDGTDGTDGYSPTVTVTEITGGHRVTITDAQGAHTFDVMDGQDGSVTVDDELSTTSENPVQNKVITEELNSTKADLSELSEDITELPNVEDSDATGVDLDVSDEDGNVLVRFKDGEIQTKEFDSQYAPIEKDSVVQSNIDLDVTDEDGHVIARLSEGGIKTKRFDSKYVLPPIEEFSVSATYVRGQTNTMTITQPFYKGDEIYFHLEDGSRYDDYGRYATYYQGSTAITGSRRGSNGYVRHIITADCNSVGVTIGSTEYTDGTALKLYVYRKNGEVKPKIVTVKADGTGMFTTLKAAVDSITDANHLTNPYVIEIYEGIYDTLEGYTDAEIRSADIGGGYTQDSMVGVKLKDGMSLKGIGRADDIILTAELSVSDYSSGVRGNISALNLEGEGNLENVTIIGKNIRYCVHDDFISPINSHDKRILRNCKFKGNDLAYAPLFTTYGAGMTAPRDYLIENCDFGYDLGIHSNSGYLFGCTIEVNNCSGTRFRIGDSASYDNDAINRVIVNNCNFQVLQITHGNSVSISHMTIEGTGNEASMVKDALATLYRLGMIDLAPTGIATGKMIKRVSSGLGFEVTNDKAVAHGIVIGSDTNFCYIQKCGYIASNYLGMSGLSVGDYITVDNSGSVVTGGTASNAVGVVTAVDDSIGFIKMI